MMRESPSFTRNTDTIARCDFAVLPNVSHFVLLQCPGEFVEAVLEFLR
jgi:pimeloyl-ACP methyl ester carboxylesterase